MDDFPDGVLWTGFQSRVKCIIRLLCDMSFHEAILAGCGGDDFILAWKQLCARMLLTYTRLDNYQQVYKEHAERLDAIRSGRKQAVIAAIKANIR